MTRIIKRYVNRKLYDTKESTYVTLDEIQKMIQEGEDLRIIDNKTKEDITNATLAQIIFEQEKSQQRTLPLSVLRSIIQSSEDFISKFQNPVHQVKEEFKQRSGKFEESSQAIKTLFEATQTHLDEIQKKIEHGLNENLTSNIKEELKGLDQRLNAVETSIKKLEVILNAREHSNDGLSRNPNEHLP